MPSTFLCRPTRALLVLGLIGAACLPVPADTTPASKSPTPAIATNAVPASATNAAPDKHGLTITADLNDDDDASAGHSSGKKHSGDEDFTEALAGALIIPIVAIVATFATPVLIIFCICYFKYRRRQETLSIVRDYLSKGLPVPPQLLEDSGKGSAAGVGSPKRRKCDLTRGFQLTCIGLGVTLALFVSDPHETTWGWGLIPMVMGIGYLLSGWVDSRSPDDRLPPSENPPVS
jgi:hypothetical protein